MNQSQPPTDSKKLRRNPYHHGDLRQSLIDAAISLIQAGEISQVSLREVARRVGVSHNAPYRHFKDREALLSAVAEQGFQGLRQATEQALAGVSSDAAQRLSAIGCAYVNYALQHPAYYRVMFSVDRDRQDESLRMTIAESLEILREVIQTGQATELFRSENSSQLAQVAWAFVHGIAMLAIGEQLPVANGKALDEFAQFSTQMLIEGFVVRQ